MPQTRHRASSIDHCRVRHRHSALRQDPVERLDLFVLQRAEPRRA
ncbi:hypothetical protein [Gemmatirosa kalamazoonensis]|nr:hypothetical protein [Gemmatirosa kalamazoonensis]